MKWKEKLIEELAAFALEKIKDGIGKNKPKSDQEKIIKELKKGEDYTID